MKTTTQIEKLWYEHESNGGELSFDEFKQLNKTMAKKPYTIRLDEEKVIKPLNKIAEKENRTVANLIETALLELVKKKSK